jgi:hypothetical protein
MKNKQIWQYSGIFLIATGILHSCTTIAIFSKVLWAMLKEGLLNSVGEDFTRGCAFWGFMFGIMLILLGYVMHYHIKKEQKPAPIFWGYWLLVLSVIGCIIMPISGFWLVIPQALIIFIANKK